MKISEKYISKISLPNRVKAFWDKLDELYSSDYLIDNWESEAFGSEVYELLKEVHPSLGCLTRLQQIAEKVDLVIFTTCTDSDAIDALKALREHRRPTWFGIYPLINLDEQLNDYGFSDIWLIHIEEKKALESLLKNSEYSFLARAFSWKDRSPVSLSYSGNTKKWEAPIKL
tara:strand:- start:7310 stop:7825 length:516 start_codon:yes stop_codon:yes gene_type:complete